MTNEWFPLLVEIGSKEFMKSELVKFVYELWIAATPLGYAIQFLSLHVWNTIVTYFRDT